jgi:hypothetical protein
MQKSEVNKTDKEIKEESVFSSDERKINEKQVNRIG